MRICLPDINVLIALHDPKHTGHDTAHEWFAQEGQHGWATCPLTENGGTLVTLDTGITVTAVVSPHSELLRKL